MSLFDTIFPKTVTTTGSTVVASNGGATTQETVTNTTVNPVLQQDISVLSHLDERSTAVLNVALEETKRIRKPLIEPEQMMFGLLSDREIFKLLQDFSIDLASLSRELQQQQMMGSFLGEPTLSEGSKQLLEQAYTHAKERTADFISPEDILLVYFSKEIDAAKKLKEKGIDKAKVEEKLSKKGDYQTGKRSVMDKYGVDLVQKAKDGKLDPITGREKELERLVHILLRRTKNNPVIIGEAGTGKTAIVEGLAQLIAAGKVSPDLANKKIIQLDISSLVAGASHRGEFEERLNGVIKEVIASSGSIILFIDEIHTLLGAGESEGSLDASNIIKPYLGRGQIQLIGATTTSEFRKNFEKDRAFERRFQPILCDEPSEEVALQMIQILQPKYEAYHKVTFTSEALKAAVHLSKRYIGERYLPDKAIDLLDEAAAQVRLAQTSGKRADNQVKDTDIQGVVSRWTGVPITKLTEKESEKLLHMEELIHQKFINHERAVKAVAEAIRRGRIGLASANRPIASFVFLGPTGTGKTELAKVLAEIMFGKMDAMIRLDMSEYMEKHEVAKLVGAPPGYVGYEEGGQLTEAVRTKPYSIVLLDEIEKAHPDVFNILLQLLDDGRLTDNKGNTISFKNTIVICTSNIGSDLIRKKLVADSTASQANVSQMAPNGQPALQPYTNPTQLNGQNQAVAPVASSPGQQSDTPNQIPETDQQRKYRELSKLVMDELSNHFKPELINRFDEVVVFEPLTEENMVHIAKLQIDGTRKMLKDQNIGLELSDGALNQLAKEGFDPVYGARPLRRLIQREIENPISILLINRTFATGDVIIVDYNKEKDQFAFNKSSFSPPLQVGDKGAMNPVTPSSVAATGGVPGAITPPPPPAASAGTAVNSTDTSGATST